MLLKPTYNILAASLEGSLTSSSGNLLSAALAGERDPRASLDCNGLEFRLIVDWKSGPPISVLLVASTLTEKAAWCSDISQVSSHSCIIY